MISKFANSIEWAFAKKDKTVLFSMQPKSVRNIPLQVFVQNRVVMKDILEDASILIEANANGIRNVNISTKVEIMFRETMKTCTNMMRKA